jgi:integrase
MASGPYPDLRRGTWSIQYFDGKKWRRKVIVKKRPGWKPGMPMPRKPPPEAIAALAEYARKEEAARKQGGAAGQGTVREFLEAYARGYVGKAEKSRIELDKAIKVFLAWCDANKVRTVDDANAPACNRWMDERAATISKRTGKPMAYATLEKERGLIAAAWSAAVRKQQVLSNPWATVVIPGKPTTKHRGSWSPEELEKILAVSRTWLRDLILIGCHTGLRIAALLALEWRDCLWSRANEAGYGFIVVRPELDKAGKGYRVPIDRVCHDVLARKFLHRDAHQVYVITGKCGRPIKSSNTTEAAICAACRRAGLKRPDSPNHHLRRTFGRQAVLGQLTGRPIPIYVVSKWLGHASVGMTEYYLDLTHDDSARWMEEFDAKASFQPDSLGNAEGGQEPVST